MLYKGVRVIEFSNLQVTSSPSHIGEGVCLLSLRTAFRILPDLSARGVRCYSPTKQSF